MRWWDWRRAFIFIRVILEDGEYLLGSLHAYGSLEVEVRKGIDQLVLGSGGTAGEVGVDVEAERRVCVKLPVGGFARVDVLMEVGIGDSVAPQAVDCFCEDRPVD